MVKATINSGLITEKLSVRTFILPGPLNLPGPGTMYLSQALTPMHTYLRRCFATLCATGAEPKHLCC